MAPREMNNNNTTAHYLVSEAKGMYRSRDEVTVTGNVTAAIDAGTILGKVTASGKYVPLTLSGTTGAETVAGILFEGVPVGVADHQRTITARDSEVKEAQLIYPAGANTAQKTAINTALRALGIIPR